MIGINKYQLDTPCLVIDLDKLTNNIIRMQKFAEAKKILVRPHAKTHKCSRIAKLQLEHGAVGVCVAKVSEAYELVKTGVTGVLITSPVVTENKIATLLKVLEFAPETMLVVDNIENAILLNSTMCVHNKTLNVLLDIDSGQLRTGVLPDKAIEIATQIDKLSHLNFMGIQCYAGHIQHIKDLDERRDQSIAILQRAGQIKRQLLQNGIACHMQTGSGTGTFFIDAEIETVTEIQPGSYTVMDKEYLDIDYAEGAFEKAMTMLTTVISVNHNTHVTVDAGTKAMYVVDTKPQVLKPHGLNYDWVFGDEHGKVTACEGGELPKLGEVLELVVAHCDPTINLFDRFYITQKDIVIDCWEINLRGKAQ
jgi:D-serine deaminase-like pyridoxal phosphate-dependent protein